MTKNIIEHFNFVKDIHTKCDLDEIIENITKYGIEQHYGVSTKNMNRKQKKHLQRTINDADYNIRTNGKFRKNDVVGITERLQKKLEQRKQSK